MFGFFSGLARSAFANLAGLVAAGYVGSLIIGGDDVPTWRFLVFLPVGLAVYLIVVVLFGGPGEGDDPPGE